ncbi:MAG: hypothetical protein KKD89_07100 [Candidatus Omnitrophica bacterium]|nr:hypothetical protein [Candidatus Omnitrophota bacterium]
MRVKNSKLAALGLDPSLATESAASWAATTDQAQSDVMRSIGVGLLVWAITRVLNRVFP